MWDSYQIVQLQHLSAPCLLIAQPKPSLSFSLCLSLGRVCTNMHLVSLGTLGTLSLSLPLKSAIYSDSCTIQSIQLGSL